MPTEPRQQLRLAAIVLAVVVAVLAAAYVTLFRTPMVPAYQNIRQNDASAIVAQLGKSGIPFRLANDGHDVLVPEDRAAEARVAVAGANLAMGGTVGFELFNDSDMGLTEFAQKINFQRAMQGELARTIMMTQGVEFARVHLALPERSIFRASQGAPSAAVTIQMAPNHMLTRQRVDGIRQLIASSVPGLSQSAVAVLDNNGALVSPALAAGSDDAPIDERSALENYYRARAREAVAPLIPDLRFAVVVSTQPAGAVRAPGQDGPPEGRLPDRDDLLMTVLVRTEAPLAPDVQARVEAALTDSLTLRREGGDTLRFATGPVQVEDTPPAPVEAKLPELPASVPTDAGTEASPRFGGWWRWVAGAALVVVLMLLARPRRQLGSAEAMSFAEQLRLSAARKDAADAG